MPFTTLGDEEKTTIRSLFLPFKLVAEGAMGILFTIREFVEIDIQ
jgi:hypothetical protein